MHTGLWCGKLKVRQPLEKPRRRWEGKIQIYLRGRGQESVDSINLEQDGGKWRAVVETEMDIRFPKNAGNVLIR
jgi:hypothetical protein